MLNVFFSQGESQPRKQKSVLVGIPRKNLQAALKRSLFRENKMLVSMRREVKELKEELALHRATIAELAAELGKQEESHGRMRSILARHHSSS